MAYNKDNKLRKIRLVQDIVQDHFIDGITTYKGIFEKYVYPIYPMTYATFITYINTPVPKSLSNEKETKS